MGIEMHVPRGPSSDKLFVYCDLKHKGKLNHILISAGCRLIGRAKLLKFAMYNVLNSYPTIVPSRGDDEVIGEVWSIGHAKLFDSLDNIKSPMSRYAFEVQTGKTKMFAWTYYMPDANFNPDASGVKRNKDGKWKV